MWKLINILALTLCFYTTSIAAHQRQDLEDASSTDEVIGTMPISSKEREMVQGHAFHHRLATDREATTNDPEHYSKTINSFHIDVNSSRNFNPEEVRGAIVSILTTSLAVDNTEVTGITIGEIQVSRVQTRARVQTKTVIDVEGGNADLYGVEIMQQGINDRVLSSLQDSLSTIDPFNGLQDAIFVQEGSIFSPTSSPSSSPSVTLNPSSSPSLSSSPSSSPMEAFVAAGQIYVDETELIGTNSQTGPIIGSVIAGVAGVGIAAAVLYAKKKGSRSGRSRGGEDDMSSISRPMKRDLDFEQYVVECCTDNDIFDNDETYFESQARTYHHKGEQFEVSSQVV